MKIFNTKLYIILLGLLLIADCSIGGYIGWWRNPFWNAVEHKNLHVFLVYIGYFTVAALVSCGIQGYSSYITSIVSLNIRTTLTRKALKLHTSIEGLPQRIQEDCFSYPSLLFGLILGAIRAVIMIGVFAVILVGQVSIVYLAVPIVYAIVGTLVAGLIAKPLINLNYVNQVLEAKFRQILTKLNYKLVHNNNYELFRITKYLNYFQSFYNQITVVVPIIVLYSLYFSAKITFGAFMQCVSSMSEIINNFSYLINSFGDVNRFLSCRKRLKEIGII